MTLEYELRDGALVWIKSPVTGVISYVVDVRGKSFAFTLGGRDELKPDPPPPAPEALQNAARACPFCPGNEHQVPPEALRLSPAEFPEWSGPGAVEGAAWIIRAFNNLFPRIPEALTGGRNESWVVVEDPRHFLDHPRSINDLTFTATLGERHFFELIKADVRMMRRILANPAVHSVVVRKNQGRESGASQPHPHQQLIGSPAPLPAVEAEVRAQRERPGWWPELLELVERLGLLIERDGPVVSYASPIGVFPRSYDIVMPGYRGLLVDLPEPDLQRFARALFRILRTLGPLPLDYEIHQDPALPLHAHVNGRLYPYSNVGGTLNLPSVLPHNAAALRKALAHK